VYISLISRGEFRGTLTGVFMAIFNMNQIIANLVSVFLIMVMSPFTLLWVFTAVGSLGIILMFFIR
jgi:hypothetical protein